MLRYFTSIIAAMLLCMATAAQVTTYPSPLQEDSRNVVIFFHANQGNKGLADMPASAQIYAHTGVITSASKSDSDWKYAPTWGDNALKYKLEYVSPNLWKLVIGDMRTYYGITDPSESILKLAFVFRTADKSKEGKAEGNKDIFVNVVDAGLQVALGSTLSGALIIPGQTSATFKLGCTEQADLKITVNGTVIGTAAKAQTLSADYNFESYGNYTVTGTATTSTGNVSTSQSYSYLPPSDSKPYPGNQTPLMGTVRNPDGSVTFCIAAPGKENVALVGAWNDYSYDAQQVMHRYDAPDGFRYFWTQVNGLDTDKPYPYYYTVDYTINVGDPYARLVLDPYNDKYISPEVYPGLPDYPAGKVPDVALAVYQENINDYDWKYSTGFKPAANSDLIIYELLLRDFTGTEGQAKGDGTVRQAIAKIPYLKSLGVNAVELLPINEFNGNISWGYNPNFYFAPDKAYGTPKAYKDFIDICHANGIAVILDMVFNQADWQHPWYKMYDAGQNPLFNVAPPHAYSVLNDWNQGFGLVQKQWHDVLRYWLEEYRVDGFRFDLVKGLGDNDSYANSSDAATNAYNASRVKRMHELQMAAQQVRPDVIIINENLASAREENEMAAFGQLNWANVNDAGCQFAMGQQSNSGLQRFYAPSDGNRKWGSTVSYLESHDEQRLAYKQNQWGVAGVKGNHAKSMQRLGSAAAQMLMAPGAHMIWQFSELGDAQNTKNANGGNNTDPKRVVWNYLDDADRAGLRQNYSELIWLRRNNPELFSQDATFSEKVTTSDWASGRSMRSAKGDKALITVVNPNVTGAIAVKVDFNTKDNSHYHIVSSSFGSNPSFNATTGTVTVEGGCYAVIATKNISGVDELVTDGDDVLRASGNNGKLEIHHAPSGYSIFTADGIPVAISKSPSGCHSVEAGIYIVRSGSHTLKISVR